MNTDEILKVLDSDTRSYLKLLINGAGKGLADRRFDLRQVFARLGPLHRDLDLLNTEVVKRKRNLARLIHNYGSTVRRLGEEDEDLTSLVRNADRVFGRLAQEDDRISLAVSQLPTTLSQTERTLVKVRELGDTAGPAFRALRPAVRRIDPLNSELRPLAEKGEPILREKVRPFVRRARPYIRDLGPAARDLGTASPDLSESFYELNRFFNIAAYNPGGAERLTGDTEQGPRPRRGPSLLARLGVAQHQLDVLHQRRPGPVPPLHHPRHLHRVPADPARPGRLRPDPRGRARPQGPPFRQQALPGLMIKQTPSIARLVTMTVFTLSCFGLLVFLWISFGGPIPLKPQGYRFEASFREANVLVAEADVRIAGLNVGKVKAKEPDVKGNATIVEMEIDEKYAPIPADTRALLRIKALLGETYVELTPGDGGGRMLPDGERLPKAAVKEAVEIDEIISLFDEETRENFQGWIRELASAIEKGRGEDLNDAIGNLPRFVATGDDVLRVLDDEEPALRRLVRNSGRTLEAINERRGQFRQLVVNANDFFGALASRNDSLAEAIFIFPTFLDQSKATLAQAEDLLARHTAARARPAAGGPRAAPDAARRGRSGPRPEGAVPQPRSADRRVGRHPAFRGALHRRRRAAPRGAAPLPEGAQPDPLLPQLPAAAGGRLHHQRRWLSERDAEAAQREEGPRHYLRAYSAINSRGVGAQRTRPELRPRQLLPGAQLPAPLAPLGISEAFDCKPTGGAKSDATNGEPPCFVAPPSLWDGGQYPRLRSGEAPVRKPPPGTCGSKPASP